MALMENEDILLLLASAYKNNEQLSDALVSVEKLLKIAPNNSYYHQQKGILLGLLGEHKKAKQLLTQSAELDPDNIEALIHLARIDVVEGNAALAISRLKQQIESQQQPSEKLLIELGNIYKNSGDIKNAAFYFEKTYSQYRNSHEALTGILSLHVINREFAKAITTAEEYLSRNNKEGSIHLALANLYMSVKDYKKADNAYIFAIKNSHAKSELYSEYAKAQLKMNNEEGAILSLQRAISWNSLNLMPYLTLFDLYLTSNRLTLASSLLDNLSKKSTDQVLIQRLKGDLNRYSNKPKQAITYYQHSIDKKINRAAIFGLYRMYNQQKEYNKALSTLDLWIKHAPNDLVAHIAIADTYTEKMQLNKATQYYQQLIKQYGEAPVLLNNLAQLQIRLERYSQAEINAEKAYKRLPNNNAITDTLAWSYSLNNKHQQALPLYRQVLTKDSNNAEIKYHLAYTLIKLERLIEAKSLLEEAINSQQFFTELPQAKKLLNSL